jgi:hypothetical protein
MVRVAVVMVGLNESEKVPLPDKLAEPSMVVPDISVAV